MPRYDYQCEDCGYVFEVIRKRKEPGPSECPECGAPAPTKLISATSFKLKGSGWYATDYRSPGLEKTAGTMPKTETDSAASDKSESSDTSASDSSGSDSGSADSAPASTD